MVNRFINIDKPTTAISLIADATTHTHAGGAQLHADHRPPEAKVGATPAATAAASPSQNVAELRRRSGLGFVGQATVVLQRTGQLTCTSMATLLF
jgi:hypothetical protein